MVIAHFDIFLVENFYEIMFINESVFEWTESLPCCVSFQVGVVAWGIECGKLGLPGVYSDVYKAGVWIDGIIHEKFGSTPKQPLLDIRSPVA